MVPPAEIAQGSDASSIFVWSVLLILLLVGGLVVALQVKKRLTQEDEGSLGAGFTLADLRQLHRDGRMTAEEFEKAKAKIVEAAKLAALRQEKAKSGPGGTEQAGR